MAGTHLTAIAAGHAAPASWRRPYAAAAIAPTTSAIISASLWPPPAKLTASSGFQPTKAQASARLRASKAARTVRTSIEAAAMIL